MFENTPLAVIAREMGLSAGSLRNKKKNCLVALTRIINAHPQYAQMLLKELSANFEASSGKATRMERRISRKIMTE